MQGISGIIYIILVACLLPYSFTAIAKITGTGKMIQQTPGKQFDFFKDAKSLKGIQNQMYIEEAPEGLLKALK